jgi:hypothetical protein
MNPDELEARLAARVPIAVPPELRGRVLASIQRGQRAASKPHRVGAQVLALAAAMLVSVNLLLSPPADLERLLGYRERAERLPEPLAMPVYLLPGISEEEIRRLTFLLRLSRRSNPAPVFSSVFQPDLLHRGS